MTTPIQSPLALNAELLALLGTIGSSGSVIIRDAAGNALATFQLANPPASSFDNQLVLLSMPTATVASSQAPVGAIPVSADIVNGTGESVVTGLGVLFPANMIILASSSVNPGAQVGIIGGCVAIP